MTLKQRLEDLERRVRELEARPTTLQPIVIPSPPWPVPMTQPYWLAPNHPQYPIIRYPPWGEVWCGDSPAVSITTSSTCDGVIVLNNAIGWNS